MRVENEDEVDDIDAVDPILGIKGEVEMLTGSFFLVFNNSLGRCTVTDAWVEVKKDWLAEARTGAVIKANWPCLCGRGR